MQCLGHSKKEGRRGRESVFLCVKERERGRGRGREREGEGEGGREVKAGGPND